MTYRNTVTNRRAVAKALGVAARIVGAVLALLLDLRRVKCRNHVLNPRTYPPQCLACWQTKP